MQRGAKGVPRDRPIAISQELQLHRAIKFHIWSSPFSPPFPQNVSRKKKIRNKPLVIRAFLFSLKKPKCFETFESETRFRSFTNFSLNSNSRRQVFLLYIVWGRSIYDPCKSITKLLSSTLCSSNFCRLESLVALLLYHVTELFFPNSLQQFNLSTHFGQIVLLNKKNWSFPSVYQLKKYIDKPFFT